MAISEDRRHALHTRLADVLGRDAAASLMEELGSVPWEKVATKDDLARLDWRIDSLTEQMNLRFEAAAAFWG